MGENSTDTAPPPLAFGLPELARIATGGDCDTQTYANALFWQLVLDKGFPRVTTEHWAVDVPEARRRITARPAVLFEGTSRDWYYCLLTFQGHPLCITIGKNRMTAEFAHWTTGDVALLMKALRDVVPVATVADRRQVPLAFWTWAERARSTVRKIATPMWADIAENYSAGTRAALATLMTEFQPLRGGQLLIWSGEAGVGKSWMVRALLWEWRRWCSGHYITDPDQFFGANARYMLDVLFEDENGRYHTDDDDEEGSMDAQKPWRLFLLEDTGELMTADAKERTGQGLSRLLNVVDGLIGQGLQILVLVTTNEEIGKLHPAVSRPGRCAFQHEFTRLSAAESSAWLAAHGSARQIDGPRTIAELYACLDEQRAAVVTPRRAGF